MNWERCTPTWPPLAAEDIPTELLRGFERYAEGARLHKVRLRWRPHGNKAQKGFLTKDRLLNTADRSCEDIAAAVASFAAHLYEQGLCENRFEAQVHRLLDDPAPGGRSSEWRSLTFYLPSEEQYPTVPSSVDDFDEELESDSDSFLGEEESDDHDDEPAVLFGEPAPRPARRPRRARRGRTRSVAPALDYKQYEEFIALSRSDPNAFAMLVVQQSHDLTVGVLTDLLYNSTDRVDTILATQVSGSRYLNEALNTVTQGAGRIAGLGVSLFERGLESQARAAREERETVLGRERNEITRDALKQGSLLVQTIIMANAAKQNQREREHPASRASPATSRRVVDTEFVDPKPEPPSDGAERTKTALELDIEAKTEHFLELLQHEPLDEPRAVAPTLCAFFERLGEGPVDGTRVLRLIGEAEHSVKRDEFTKVHSLVSAELASAFANLMMHAMSEHS